MSESQPLSGSLPIPGTFPSLAAVNVALGQVVKQSILVDAAVDLAIATSIKGSLALGFAAKAAAAGNPVPIFGIGSVITLEAAEWAALTDGATAMALGNLYYVSPTTAGNITTVAPDTGGQFPYLCLQGISAVSARVVLGVPPVAA